MLSAEASVHQLQVVIQAKRQWEQGPKIIEKVDVAMLLLSLAVCNSGCLPLVLRDRPFLHTAHPFQYTQAALGGLSTLKASTRVVMLQRC